MRWTLILLLLVAGCTNNKKDNIQTFEVDPGEFILDVVETGEIDAINAITISSPLISWRFGMLKITKIVDDGTKVNKGDTVLIFDPSEVHKAIIDAEAELEIARAEYKKLETQQELKIAELEADLKVSEINHEISTIELDQATFEADIRKKEIQLNLEKAKINLEKAKEEIKNQRQIQKEELQREKIAIDQLENELKEAKETLKKLTVVSPGSGVAVVRRNWSTRTKWQEGDQPWPGESLINLPDLNELMVETNINEVDISKINMDQPAEIRIDAYSDERFTGEVISIASLATFKNDDSKIKVFPVEIRINEQSDKLLPGMTVSSRILVDRIDSVLFVPHEAIFEEQQEKYVYLKSAGSFKKETVKLGLANNDFVIITEGLEEGDEIALSNPFAMTNGKSKNEEKQTKNK